MRDPDLPQIIALSNFPDQLCPGPGSVGAKTQEGRFKLRPQLLGDVVLRMRFDEPLRDLFGIAKAPEGRGRSPVL